MLCSLRPAALRRQHGAFYTPSVIGAAMVNWLLAHRLDRVVDPGCGSGRFAVMVSRQQPDIPLIAIDTDPLATLLTRAALAVVGARDVQVLQQDYFSLTLPSYAGRTGFIANPPYVRHHDLSAEAKAWAAAAGKRLGMAISGLAGLHALFFLATALNAHPGDVGCFVTSAEWLDTRYGQAIRQLLVERLGLRVLAMLDPQAVPFADAMTTAAITCFVMDSPAEQVALDLIDAPESLRLGTADATVERRQLAHAARWSPLLRRKIPLPDAVERVPLRMIARVHRGVATGSNEFFILSRGRAARLGLLPWCRPAITRAAEILQANGVVHDGPERRLLLVVAPDIDRRAHPALDAYLRLGEQEHEGKPAVAAGYLARHRTPWWYLGPVTAPAIVAI
jgi:methylase of polypeptide subunit release factors